jgi:hypothetical protein
MLIVVVSRKFGVVSIILNDGRLAGFDGRHLEWLSQVWLSISRVVSRGPSQG